MKTLEITLSAKEIQFLSELLRIELLVGMQDPYEHYSEDQVKTSWMETRDLLLEKQILFERDTYEIERGHAILIDAMRPQFTYCRVQHIAERKQIVSHFHLTPMLAIKRMEMPESENHTIRLVGTPAEAVEEIKHSFTLPVADHVDAFTFTLEKGHFDRLIGSPEQSELVEILSSVGEDGIAGLRSFLSDITTPLVAGEVEKVVWDDRHSNWQNEILHFIIGKDDVWLIIPETDHGQENFRITKSTKVEVEASIEKMLL